MHRLTWLVLASGIIIAMGVVLLAVPSDDAEFSVYLREEVSIEPFKGMGTNIDLSRGRYQVWIEDIDPAQRDWGHFEFAIESIDEPIDIVVSDGSEVRDIDGVPHELYCSFTISRYDMYFYETSSSKLEGDEESFDLVFSRSSAFADRPLLWPGMILIIFGTAAVVGIILRHLWREYRFPPVKQG